MVERVDVNSVLMQMRQVKETLRAQHQINTQQTNGVAPTAPPSSFEQLLQQQKVGSADQKAISPKLEPLPVNPNETVNLYGNRGQAIETPAVAPSDDSAVPNFRTMFGNAIDQVNQNQKTAGSLATRFEQGDPNVDLPEVMIALQKSSVSFQAMTQVRNKLVEAYKDIMNMPV